MAPFPSRHVRKPSDTLLPTFHSPSPASSSPSHSPPHSGLGMASSAQHAYPPLPVSPSPSQPSSPRPRSPVSTRAPAPAASDHHPLPHQQLDPLKLFGAMAPPTKGNTGGLGGITAESTETVRRCLEENHIHSHTFFNDKGFHNHCSHHLLASYSLGASPALLEDIYKLHHETAFKPMPPLAPEQITEANWTQHLGDEQYYPNYLAFFHRLIAPLPPASSAYAGRKSSAIPVLERFLFGGDGQMLARAVSGAIHPLIHIGHGLEFGLDAHVAEGLAQCAVHQAKAAPLFPEEWPPCPPRPSQLQSTLSSAFLSLGFTSSIPSTSVYTYFGGQNVASPRISFAATAAALPRDKRFPRVGLSGFTILSRILHDEALAPGRACTLDDFPKLDAVLRNRASRVVQWCEEWRFSNERVAEWEDAEAPSGTKPKLTGVTPEWAECVEKCEELWWMATVIYAASSRPGYKDVKLDFFLMHGLTSILFLPPLLEAISPHLRPYLLTSHFRILVAYWVSRGRPDLHVADTLMAATAFPRPPPVSAPPATTAVRRALDENRHNKGHDPEDPSSTGADGGVESPATPKAMHAQPFPVPSDGDVDSSRSQLDEDDGSNPWMRVLASAVDHDDEHATKVVRSLYYAAQHFGASQKGMFTSSLPGSELMDGSIFIRAAGLTLASVGWAHEGVPGAPGSWDRSSLGFPSTWDDSELLPGASWPPYPSSSSFSDRKGKSREPSAGGASFSSASSSRPASFSRSRSGTIIAGGQSNGTTDHDVVHFGTGDSALLSPQAASGGFGFHRAASPGGSVSASSSRAGSRQGSVSDSYAPRTSRDGEHSRSASPGLGASGSVEGRVGWRKVGEEVTDEDRNRQAIDEEEHELMG
ncbi:hypothetical protein JCM9279_005126 [Rhodotorula babjevae]